MGVAPPAGPPAGSALPPPGAGPTPAQMPSQASTPLQVQPTPDGGSKAARRSLMIVIGAALAVVLATVGFVVTRGGDEDAGDNTELTDDTEATDETEAPDTEATDATASTDTTDLTAPTESTEAPTTSEAVPETTSPAGDLVAGAPPGASGTRESPVAVGRVADIGQGWRLQVVDVVADATPAVMAENQFNEAPPAGSTFTIVRVALGYFGLADPASFFTPTVSAIGAAAVELDTDCGVIPQSLDVFSDVFAGGTIVGNLCFVTTPADPPMLQLYASADFFTDSEVFLDAAPPAAPIPPFGAVIGPQPGAAATPSRTTGAVPIGAANEVGEGWAFAVLSPARDITDQVMTDNSFNDPPPEGFRFVGVDVALAYSGTGAGSGFDVTAKWVGGGNVQRTGFCGVVNGEVDLFTDVFAGGSVTGTMCFVVPQQEVGGGVVYVTAGFDAEPVYFATS